MHGPAPDLGRHRVAQLVQQHAEWDAATDVSDAHDAASTASVGSSVEVESVVESVAVSVPAAGVTSLYSTQDYRQDNSILIIGDEHRGGGNPGGGAVSTTIQAEVREDRARAAAEAGTRPAETARLVSARTCCRPTSASAASSARCPTTSRHAVRAAKVAKRRP